MKHVLCLLAILLLRSFAMAGNDGAHAGGGLQISGRNYTLCELGLECSNKPSEPYYLDRETITATTQELKKLDEILPQYLKGVLYKAVFDPSHIYQNPKVVSPDVFASKKEEYQKYVDTLSVKGKFILAAYTIDHTTSLLPDFFDPGTSMDDRSSWLISHEAVYFLKPNAPLDKILNFEGALHKFNQAPQDYNTWMPVYDALVDLKFLSRASAKALYVRLLGLQGKTLTMANFVRDDLPLLSINEQNDCKPKKGYRCGSIVVHCPPDASIILSCTLKTDPVTLRFNDGIDPEFFRRFYDSTAIDQERGEDFYGETYALRTWWVSNDIHNDDLLPSKMRIEYYEVRGVPSLKAILKLKNGKEVDLSQEAKQIVFLLPRQYLR